MSMEYVLPALTTRAEFGESDTPVPRLFDEANPFIVRELNIESPDGTTIVAKLDTPSIEQKPIRVTSITKSEPKMPAVASGRG